MLVRNLQRILPFEAQFAWNWRHKRPKLKMKD